MNKKVITYAEEIIKFGESVKNALEDWMEYQERTNEWFNAINHIEKELGKQGSDRRYLKRVKQRAIKSKHDLEKLIAKFEKQLVSKTLPKEFYELQQTADELQSANCQYTKIVRWDGEVYKYTGCGFP